MKLRIDKRSPHEMTEEEFERYGQHLQDVQARGAYRGAYGQPGAVSDAARQKALAASKELSRIQYGLGYPKATAAESEV